MVALEALLKGEETPAVLATSIFYIRQAKEYLAKKGIPVRL